MNHRKDKMPACSADRVPPGNRAERMACLILLCALAAILAVELLLCLTPPVSRDALIHHLAIPKLWIRHGGWFETPWAQFSYFPMNVDLLYLVSLMFGNDALPALIHLLFGWGTGYLVYRYLRDREGRAWGLLGLLVFASTPMVIRLSVTAYVDLGLLSLREGHGKTATGRAMGGAVLSGCTGRRVSMADKESHSEGKSGLSPHGRPVHIHPWWT